MILINDKPICLNRFPDRTLALRITPAKDIVFLNWHYESDEEMAAIYYITKHLKSAGNFVHLSMPYIPNARMDRVKNDDEIFTLKYFSEFINSLGFESVCVEDPHSNVCYALINNLNINNGHMHVKSAINDINDEELVLYYPDEGAMKRYSEMIKDKPYAFGVKRRDWRTGGIQGITLINEDVVSGKNVLIVDDICSKGGTFFHSAKALKAAGANDIFLYITHCENTIFEGELIDSDLIKHIYTTDSIFSLSHEKITVFR